MTRAAGAGASTRDGVEAPVGSAFREALLERRLLVATGVEGVYLRSGAFESVVAGIDRLVSNSAADENAEQLHLPLVVPRRLLERTDYVRSFPDLAGAVTSFAGGERAYPALLEALEVDRDGTCGDWADLLEPTDLALSSAACHSLYPLLAGEQGGPWRFEVVGQVFRHEPSPDPARMQAFRMHEVVFVGEPAGALEHRDRWAARALSLLAGLGLEAEAVVANDPFFGRSGGMLAANQRQDALKLEIVAPISSVEHPSAIASSNYHLDHFGTAFGIQAGAGRAPAHSACAGFGLERIALALLAAHGLEPGRWPAGVRRKLGL